jgi:glucosylceramidase
VASSHPASAGTVILTAEAGARCERRPNIRFTRAGPERPPSTSAVVSVFPDDTRQGIEGIGSSLTEASAFVLAHLEPDARREVMARAFGASGANLTLARTHIGSCDFTVHGRYAYQASAKAPFSVACDRDGFDPARHPGIRDRDYDLLP